VIARTVPAPFVGAFMLASAGTLRRGDECVHPFFTPFFVFTR